MKDDLQAYQWVEIAVANSSGEMQMRYARLRDLLSTRLTPDAVAEAQKRARELQDQLEHQRLQEFERRKL
jgi:hypothetical protein